MRPPNHAKQNITGLSALAFLLVSFSAADHPPAECLNDADCVALYREGSICLKKAGKCTNPFVSGCLHGLKPLEYEKRICNFDDGSNRDHCRDSSFDYPEIRIHNQNWESAIFISWIFQIYLMEFLEVPVTVGLGKDTEISSFYYTENNLPYSNLSYSFDAIRTANDFGGNCRLTDDHCVHVIPDAWQGQRKEWNQAFDDGQIDFLDGNGQVGKISWYVPRFTAKRHAFSTSHITLTGNREKVAEVFKRPTTWKEYCDEVSDCSGEDGDGIGIADRYPNSDEEGNYFADGYKGHFRYTAKNNCTGENSNKCTGHIVNAPCSWSTFLQSQAYWNDIAVESDGTYDGVGGYSSSEMLQIWAAANATKSDVMMWWYEPDPTLEAYRNTDAEFTRIFLPTPTRQCRDSRVKNRCDSALASRLGQKEGSCDNIGHTTKKIIASSLRTMTTSVPEVDQSPGFFAIRNFNIDDLDVRVMLQDYTSEGGTNYAARKAVCEWVGNNVDYLNKISPIGYPRTIQEESGENQRAISYAAQAFGTIATIYVIVASFFTYKMRKRQIFVYAQVQFIFVVLFGLLLVSLSAVLFALKPSKAVCISRPWLIGLGYTCELVPLIIKVSALNHLMRASRRLKRIKVNPNALYAKVFGLTCCVAVYLTVWTAVDPPMAVSTRSLSEDKTTITTQVGCRSENSIWRTLVYFWDVMLVCWAFVLAFQSRSVTAQFNESRSLATMVYSHFVFAALRVTVEFLFVSDAFVQSIATSFLLSIDVISAISIYLIPKLIASEKKEEARSSIHVSGAFMTSDSCNKSLSHSFVAKNARNAMKPESNEESPPSSAPFDDSEELKDHVGKSPRAPKDSNKSSVDIWTTITSDDEECVEENETRYPQRRRVSFEDILFGPSVST